MPLSTAPARDPGAAYDELRGLLLGPEQEDIRRLKESLSTARSAEEISRALAEAVRLASQRNRKLRSAMQPIVEQSIRLSVRQNPAILGDALWPIIGDSVRKAVASALRQLAESIHETLEQSFTVRSFLWRVQSIRSGKPYGEIALVHSALYRVDRVFLIHRETGLLLAEKSADSSGAKDGDQISAMLIAIQDFVKDSFGDPTGNAVETIEAGEFAIWVQQSPHAVLAALIRGVPPKALKEKFDSVLQRIGVSHERALANFDGDTTPFEACQPELAACFLGKGEKARARPGYWPLWLAAILTIAGVAGYFYWSARQARHWQDFVASLRHEPGIVVAESGKHAGKYLLSGFRDPLARNPAQLAQRAGFSRNDIDFNWQEYTSRQAPLAALHDFFDARQHVESRRIHFQTDISQIPLEQLSNLHETAQQISELLSAAKGAGKTVVVQIAGHTDNSGSEQRNFKLSEERAAQVAAALISLGVPSRSLSTNTAEIPAPAAQDTDLARAFNRYVAFHVQSAIQ